MGHSHSHNHSLHHAHSHHQDLSEKKLYLAVVVNVLLTVLQLVGGLVSGSLSLVADAVHNLSDAGSLVIAAFASKVAKLPGNEKMTYGYRRAEILGALINSTSLILVGVYLIYEAFHRFFEPSEIQGWIVVVVGGIALVIDLVTALLTYSGSKHSINIRAVFIHNLSDAMASLAVVMSGTLIILYKMYWVDLLVTLLIAIYILYHSYGLIKQCILILMQSVPEGIQVNKVKQTMNKETHVKDVHHLHIWQLDDKKLCLEAHVVIEREVLSKIEEIKISLRKVLKKQFNIDHSTLEIEISDECQIHINRESP